MEHSNQRKGSNLEVLVVLPHYPYSNKISSTINHIITKEVKMINIISSSVLNLERRGSNLDALVDLPYLNQLLKGNYSKSINDNQFNKVVKIKCIISILVLNIEGRRSNLDALVDLPYLNKLPKGNH